MTGMGNLFLEIAPQLNVYGPYMENFRSSLETLTKCDANFEAFSSFIAKVREKTAQDLQGLGLFHLLGSPVGHIAQFRDGI